MHRLIAVAALVVGMPGAAQDRDYRITAEIGVLGAEPVPSTGGDYEMVAGIRALPPPLEDRLFTDSFEPAPNGATTEDS